MLKSSPSHRPPSVAEAWIANRFGLWYAAADRWGVRRLRLIPIGAAKSAAPPGLGSPEASPEERMLERMLIELQGYFAGMRRTFETPLSPALEMSVFMRETADAVRRIAYGSVATYSQVAERMGRPGARRAIGQALARNPVLLYIPCHRVVAATGKLAGFSAGTAAKARLIAFEAHMREGR